jgi:hypothetical protein
MAGVNLCRSHSPLSSSRLNRRNDRSGNASPPLRSVPTQC